MMRQLILFWFKGQASKAAQKVLVPYCGIEETEGILEGYYSRYKNLRKDVRKAPTLGGSVMVHLAAMSTAFYRELTNRGKQEEMTIQFFYVIAWEVYKKMGRFSWWLAGWGNRNDLQRLLKATKLFRGFPFNSPSYRWEEVQTEKNVVGFNCTQCPVATYFQKQNLSSFCVKTWCALDYSLAALWNAKLERTGSIAGGAEKCDFRWIV